MKAESFIILVADKYVDMQMFLRHSVKHVGSVIGASDGLEVLQILRSTQVDLVVLDIDLPLIACEELCYEVKRSQPGIPILLMTSRSAAFVKRHVTACQPYDMFYKPFDPTAFKLVVEKLAKERA